MEHSTRLGVFAHDTATGQTLAFRAEERFPMCSVNKTLAAAAVLRDLDCDGQLLAKRISYTRRDVTAAGYSPITAKPENLTTGMTVAELCAAAISFSDNTAMNLLLCELGGPAVVTRFVRSFGDQTTRLDRYCPFHATAEPWQEKDTSTPHAIARTYAQLTLGSVLTAKDREQLTGWLLANTTSSKRFRAALPAGWSLADKTGTGLGYGTTNDVGIAWPPQRKPIVLAVMSTKPDAHAPTDEPLVAKTASVLIAEFGR